jgi:recombinational DNA repair protein (RecF pathway)
MKSPKRKFEPQSIGKVLDEIVQSKALKTGITNARINELWYELMGTHMTHYTEKILLKGNTLFVSLNNAALREELNYGKEKIREIMNEHLGGEVLKKIVLR